MNVRPGNKSYIIENYKVISDDDYLDIFLLQLLIKNQIYVLRIEYTADLNEEPIGLFRSEYRNKLSNITRLVTSYSNVGERERKKN